MEVLPYFITTIGLIVPIIATNNIIFLSTGEPITDPEMYVDFPKLWQLNMSNQTTFEFPVDRVLLAHKKLARFYCNNCSVHSIYKESFSMLRQLSHLELDYNNLSYIHPDAFWNNPLLQKVQLIGNNLLTFNPEATLRHVTYLSFLKLDRNPGFNINRVHMELPWLVYFCCKYCNTSFLDQSTMRRWKKLGHLNLPNNHIDRIEHDAFTEMVRFKHLNVDDNPMLTKLTIQSKTLFNLTAERCGLEGTLDTSSLPALECVNVRSNRISKVNEHGFQNNGNIKRILLDDNEIEKIPEKLLEMPLHDLEALCIDRNPLQPREILSDFNSKYFSRKLRRGCLDDGNPSKAFEQNLPSKNGIALYRKRPDNHMSKESHIADLSSRNIVFIDEDYFENATNVAKVILDNNSAFDFPSSKAFLRSEFIAEISLANCAITSIHEQTLKLLPNIRSINLKGNNIKSLHSATIFQNNIKIEHLNLADNELEFLVFNQFQNLKLLQTLNLNHNRYLSNVRWNPFLVSSSLEKLSCQSCGLYQIDAVTLSGLTNLTELNLGHNFITTIAENAFRWTDQLRRLDLSHNRLYTFEPDLLRMSSLQTLCLAGNQDFNFELPTSQALVRNTPEMVRLEKHCSEATFSSKLVVLYNNMTASARMMEFRYEKAGILQLDNDAASCAVTYMSNCAVLIPISLIAGDITHQIIRSYF